MNHVLVGEVKSAEAALRGLLGAGVRPIAVFTTDVSRRPSETKMDRSYYADLETRCNEAGLSITVIQEAAELEDYLRMLPNVDIAWVVGWPYIVNASVVDSVTCIGMHPTRLPARRGGAPLNWVLLDDCPETAVTLFRLRKGLDDGEILIQDSFRISNSDYIDDVLEKTYALTENLVMKGTRDLLAGKARWSPQNHREATFTRRRSPADGQILWNDSAIRIRNLIRASSHPFPGAHSLLGGSTLRVWRAELPVGYRAPLRAAPGEVLSVDGDRLVVATRDNALLITKFEIEDWCGPRTGLTEGAMLS